MFGHCPPVALTIFTTTDFPLEPCAHIGPAGHVAPVAPLAPLIPLQTTVSRSILQLSGLS